MLYHLILIISGLLVSRLLFFRFPRLEPTEEAPAPRRLSVIIPARDEARTLPLLLDDLARQDVPIHEIIGVDDHSSDGTAAVIRSAGVVYQAAGERPPGWIGKSWACQTGAEAAGGDVLLFLDADVRPSRGPEQHCR
ncbi:MAG: glycosyltransferase [Eubacteriales bacterium]|nr:glycosyltransferase [Eubacteriales bacterium]